MELSTDALRTLATEHSTPLFVYDLSYLSGRAQQLVDLQLPYGLTARYAVKANNNPRITALLDEIGLSFDASSSYEVVELLGQGIDPTKVSLSSQQPAHNLPELVASGIKYVATSLHQLELFIAQAPKGSTVGLRVNPGLGAGHNNRTTTGGANSSFGLWNTYIPQALKLASDANIVVDRLHIHIGSGADPKMWGEVMKTSLAIAELMPNVTSLDIGGGFKIHRYGDEHEADMVEIGEVFSKELKLFADRTGRQLHLEIEPGTWLIAHAGVLLAKVVDIVDTGADGHVFLRLNTGMNDIIRPSMYGAQHRIGVLSDSSEREEYVIVGHNCETGDILTPAPGDPEGLEARLLPKAHIDDIVVIYDAGAYCASFAVHGYNSYPSAKEIFV
ncbi:MAG: Diaminopimelate decarboxylase [Candidatus Saccharibacteria bacterium]|nr:Diaminopimelate decarboxylase [Candidatus Saccharibacteria bacterium]